jgi:hypothetical protein
MGGGRGVKRRERNNREGESDCMSAGGLRRDHTVAVIGITVIVCT